MPEYDYFNGENFITFDLIEIDDEKREVTVAVSDNGRISVKTFDLLFDGTQAFSTYEKAVERFNEIIENEKNTDMSWAGNAFENDKLQKNYELDRNETFTDGKEHELWWNLSCKLDWYLHEFLELRILEVDSNEL